jgi:hypothetical protein
MPHFLAVYYILSSFLSLLSGLHLRVCRRGLGRIF